MPRTLALGDKVEWRTEQSGLVGTGTIVGFPDRNDGKSEIVIPDDRPPNQKVIVNIESSSKADVKAGQYTIKATALFKQ